MEKVIAKMISGDDIKHMYESKIKPGTCPICNNTIEKIPNILYARPRKKGDILYTYDGFSIVTEKFKTFCEERQYPNLEFTPLEAKGFYFFMPQDVYLLDPIRRGIRFINKRDCCGNYDDVIGATPGYTAPDFKIDSNDFIRSTQYYFGSGSNKAPFIVIGIETEKAMKKYGIKGLSYSNVYL